MACKKQGEFNQVVVNTIFYLQYFDPNGTNNVVQTLTDRHSTSSIACVHGYGNNLAKYRQMVVPETSTFGWCSRTDTSCRTTWHNQQQRSSRKFPLLDKKVMTENVILTYQALPKCFVIEGDITGVEGSKNQFPLPVRPPDLTCKFQHEVANNQVKTAILPAASSFWKGCIPVRNISKFSKVTHLQ